MKKFLRIYVLLAGLGWLAFVAHAVFFPLPPDVLYSDMSPPYPEPPSQLVVFLGNLPLLLPAIFWILPQKLTCKGKFYYFSLAVLIFGFCAFFGLNTAPYWRNIKGLFPIFVFLILTWYVFLMTWFTSVPAGVAIYLLVNNRRCLTTR